MERDSSPCWRSCELPHHTILTAGGSPLIKGSLPPGRFLRRRCQNATFAGGQLTIWDTILPAEVREWSAELAKIDALLDDDRFFKPYMKEFSQRMGRPTVPVDTFHRLMYLRHRHQLSYEALVREVQDSIMWRQFCRIPLDDRVPDSTTLVKLVKKFGPDILDQLNETLICKAKEQKVLRGKKSGSIPPWWRPTLSTPRMQTSWRTVSAPLRLRLSSCRRPVWRSESAFGTRPTRSSKRSSVLPRCCNAGVKKLRTRCGRLQGRS